MQFWAPAAAGSGVSLVIAYLNGNAVPDLLNARSLAVKWAGTMCSVSANLTVGPEAPMVHLGACTSHLVAHLLCGKILLSHLQACPWESIWKRVISEVAVICLM